MPVTPVLIGTIGVCAGLHFALTDGVPATVGRSSTCEVCLQKSPRFLALSEEQRAKLTDFNVISRRHLTITVTGSIVHLENHSAAGTWCDDARFDKSKQVDLAAGPISLRLGPTESFQLALLDEVGLERLNERTTPIQLMTTRLGRDDAHPTGPRPAVS